MAAVANVTIEIPTSTLIAVKLSGVDGVEVGQRVVSIDPEDDTQEQGLGTIARVMELDECVFIEVDEPGLFTAGRHLTSESFEIYIEDLLADESFLAMELFWELKDRQLDDRLLRMSNRINSELQELKNQPFWIGHVVLILVEALIFISLVFRIFE